MGRDTSLDALLGLDGEVFVIDADAGLWVQFRARAVPASEAKPHGLDYSLTLHDRNGERLVGFDNAHAVAGQSGPGGRKKAAFDHKHRLRTVQPYDYADAATLLEDFWAAVDAVLREKGVIR
jgi:Family of unknown function (DUF6516)